MSLQIIKVEWRYENVRDSVTDERQPDVVGIDLITAGNVAIARSAVAAARPGARIMHAKFICHAEANNG